MRVYLPVGADHLRAWSAGDTVRVEGYVAVSTDEEDELAALEAAAEEAPAVAVVEITDPDGPIAITDVEALHAATDDSGHLSWFGTQELDAVLILLT